MTARRGFDAASFSATADDYAATMAPALAPVAADVVRRASLRAAETVLDVGTGTGTAAGLAAGQRRRVIGLDGAAGMLVIARRRLPDVEFIEADFLQIPIADGSIDVVIAVHALLFADDRVAALREWRRVTRAGGRLSLSVPGPGDVVPSSVLGGVYDRYDVRWGTSDFPMPPDVVRWAEAAGWREAAVEADPSTSIPLADEVAYRAWLRVGSRLQATTDWPIERREQFARDLISASPRGPDGGFRLPFGTIYLSATNPRQSPE